MRYIQVLELCRVGGLKVIHHTQVGDLGERNIQILQSDVV